MAAVMEHSSEYFDSPAFSELFYPSLTYSGLNSRLVDETPDQCGLSNLLCSGNVTEQGMLAQSFENRSKASFTLSYYLQ